MKPLGPLRHCVVLVRWHSLHRRTCASGRFAMSLCRKSIGSFDLIVLLPLLSAGASSSAFVRVDCR
jgi:hypothetical protein